MQTIICKMQQCGYCSSNGFCLNKLTVINDQGVCDYLTKPGWNKPVEDRFKNTYRAREPVTKILKIGSEEK